MLVIEIKSINQSIKVNWWIRDFPYSFVNRNWNVVQS